MQYNSGDHCTEEEAQMDWICGVSCDTGESQMNPGKHNLAG